MAVEPETSGAPGEDPDSAEKPSSPTQISKPSWSYVLRRTAHEFRRDECTDSAAVMTFFAVLSVFPALLAVVSLLGVVGQAEATAETLLRLLHEFGVPDQAVAVVEGPVRELAGSPSAGLTLVTGLLGALWTASAYVRAFGRSMNRIYEVEEGRPFWKLYPLMVGITLLLVVLAVGMMMLLLLSGPVAERLGELVGLPGSTLRLWQAARVPVMLALLAFMVVLLYSTTPNVRQPRFRWLGIGSVTAIAVMAAATAGFSYYVSSFGNFNATYGAIGGVIVLLLWIWIMNTVLLAGAEFNAETERARQLQAGIAAEENLRLPPRDVRAARKLRQKEQELVEEGRDLRRRYADVDYREAAGPERPA
ncbi:YihY/virulence factor BrkB family protein [Kocuria sp. SM24M-10]|uniref:YihY/virulence factor BrkB family protein n=1 Tax=Kocuria sp. SM24M-10 TaxID=1660349 RepID=UPI0006498EFC|nr:YihY/virulence factor BrkB family protein [Kocuria sp. SM24M-10]KLU11045.1 ribonuclease BN [Kocuria sp. SM24M-10]